MHGAGRVGTSWSGNSRPALSLSIYQELFTIFNETKHKIDRMIKFLLTELGAVGLQEKI